MLEGSSQCVSVLSVRDCSGRSLMAIGGYESVF